jgi:hypothetical protein
MKRHGLLIIAVDNMFTLSLNVFICLNACGLYNICTVKEFPMIRHRSPRVRMRKPTVTQKEEEAPEGDNLVEEIIFPEEEEEVEEER